MIEKIIIKNIVTAIHILYRQQINENLFQVQKTKKEFKGDLTLVVFPLLRFSKKSPEQTAEEIGDYLQSNLSEIDNFNVIRGFLNLTISENYWLDFFNNNCKNVKYGFSKTTETHPIVVEFSSPNTNKPLHLGHIRNNLIGNSVAEILKASGKKVVKVNLVNDRGIHISKSMLAWEKWGRGDTPESSGKKGDKLVGDYYVKSTRFVKKMGSSAG
jgi:arginyl-tRNA synthetase